MLQTEIAGPRPVRVDVPLPLRVEIDHVVKVETDSNRPLKVENVLYTATPLPRE
jgi:hypothetical protein